MHPVRLVVHADRRILPRADIAQRLVQRALAQAGRLQRARDQHRAGAALRQARADLIAPHPRHLRRRPGHRHHDRAILLHPPARRRPARIRNRPPRRHDCRLLHVLLRHLPAAALEERAQMRLQLRRHIGLLADRLGDRLARDVVLRRSQPAGAEHDLRAPPRLRDQIDQPLAVVADLVHVEQVDAHRRQALRDVLGVRVENLAHEDFGADGDDFCSHACILEPRVREPVGAADSLRRPAANSPASSGRRR